MIPGFSVLSPQNIAKDNRQYNNRKRERNPARRKEVREWCKGKKCECSPTCNRPANAPHHPSDDLYKDKWADLSECIPYNNKCHHNHHKGLERCPTCGGWMKKGSEQCYACYKKEHPELVEQSEIAKTKRRRFVRGLRKKKPAYLRFPCGNRLKDQGCLKGGACSYNKNNAMSECRKAVTRLNQCRSPFGGIPIIMIMIALLIPCTVSAIQLITPDQPYDLQSVQSSAIIQNGGEYYLFYGCAGNESVDLKHDHSICLVTGKSLSTFKKYKNNPVINRKSIGLNGFGNGVAPFDIRKFGETYYLYCSLYRRSSAWQIVAFTSTDLYNWSDYIVIISDQNNNHAPYILQLSDGTLLMYYCYQEPGADFFNIGVAIGNNPLEFSPYKENPIFGIKNNSTVYPFVYTDWRLKTYLYYARTDGEAFRYSIYRASNAGGAEELVLSQSGNGFDSGYVTTPRIYYIDRNLLLFYSGKTSNQDGVYKGIGYVRLKRAQDQIATHKSIENTQ